MTDDTDDEPNSFFERVVTDSVKRRMVEIAYGACEGIEDLNGEEIGALLGGILGYGVYLGLALARDEILPPEHEVTAFLVMHPEIISAVERAKQHS